MPRLGAVFSRKIWGNQVRQSAYVAKLFVLANGIRAPKLSFLQLFSCLRNVVGSFLCFGVCVLGFPAVNPIPLQRQLTKPFFFGKACPAKTRYDERQERLNACL